MLTKAEALNKLNEIKRNSQHNGYMWASDVEDLFCKIYDKYEAQFKEFNKIVEETHFQNEQEHKIQLKAKDESLKLTMDLSEHMLIELKTERDIKEYLAKELKAKNEEIERLNCRAYHAEGYINDLHNHPKDKKFYDAKARSIVAMLFWEARKTLTEYRNTEHCDALYNYYYGQKQQFIEAYAILKDNT